MSLSSCRADGFTSGVVYKSSKEPGYAAWVSFFPGEEGAWYIGCEEVSVPERPLKGATREQLHTFNIPRGYDKSTHLMEMVLLKSTDDLENWHVVSREAERFQHTAGQFGQAKVGQDRLIRFVWNCYSLEANSAPGEILRVSDDGGLTWAKHRFHDDRFASYPHRLRTLRDGTLVLALPLAPPFGPERPRGACTLAAESEMSMNLVFSYDGGESWSQALPIYGGRRVTETDFVELPDGDLLCVNNTIFGDPGRQRVYRTDYGFVPGAYERCRNCQGYVNVAPETVALNEEGILVGAMRNGRYMWSDDLGLHWYPLAGIPDYITDPTTHNAITEIYQPWINYIGDGEFACAGHYGYDDPLEKGHDNFINLHRFRLVVERQASPAEITIRRIYEGEGTDDYTNRYLVHFEADGNPVTDREVELWFFVNREDAGYDDWNRSTLAERIERGGRVVRGRTGSDGSVEFHLGEFDSVTDIHHYVQMVARYVPGEGKRDIQEAVSLLYGFYTLGA